MNLERLWYRYIAASHTATYGITFEYLLIIWCQAFMLEGRTCSNMRFLNLVIASAVWPMPRRNSCWTICLPIFAICLLPKVLPFKCTIASRALIAMLTIVLPMFTSSLPCSSSGGDEHNLSPSSPSWVMLHYKSHSWSTMYIRPFYKIKIKFW